MGLEVAVKCRDFVMRSNIISKKLFRESFNCSGLFENNVNCTHMHALVLWPYLFTFELTPPSVETAAWVKHITQTNWYGYMNLFCTYKNFSGIVA